MKFTRQSVRVVFVASALAALSGVAAAGGEHQAERAQCRAAREAEFLPVYDANRDGQLDRTERQKLRQDRRQKALARYDADRDGQLNQAEWTKLRSDKVAERFAKLDVNRDGSITRQEVSGACSRIGHHFDEVDQNRDGRITSAELAAARLFGKRGKFGGFHHGQGHHDGQPADPDAQEL